MPQAIPLMFGVLPLWWMAGWADWFLHRRSHIERTAGLRESGLHLLMLGEMAVAVLVVLWLQINAAVLMVCLAAFVAHEITVYVDLRWSATRRSITPLEQMVHSVQEMLPLVGLALLASAHWGQATALLGLGEEEAVWSFVRKQQPLPSGYVAFALLGSALVAGCYLQEYWRCMRSRPAAR